MAAHAAVGSFGGPAPVASWRHTARMTAIFLAIGVTGAALHLRAGGAPAAPAVHPHLAVLYLSLIATEWMLFRGIVAGLRSTGTAWQALLGRASPAWTAVSGDVAVGVLVATGYVSAAWAVGHSAGHAVAEGALLPQGALETALWIALSASAGFCEEIAFRGYFQAQFEALTRSKTAALILQAALFGAAHAYQGLGSAVAIAAYGAAFGGLALWRRSLRPGIVAHALTDLALGLLGR
jgi:CAAX protease family protein